MVQKLHGGCKPTFNFDPLVALDCSNGRHETGENDEETVPNVVPNSTTFHHTVLGAAIDTNARFRHKKKNISLGASQTSSRPQSDLVWKVGLGVLSLENTIYRTGAVRTNQIDQQ